MFTFGREHERKCAVAYVRNPAQAELILQVVDAVHDFLEGKAPKEPLSQTIRTAFVDGGSGVWEQAGSWLRKLCSECPQLGELWIEFAQSQNLNVRFRVACSLDDIPNSIISRVTSILLADKSKKVAAMARERSSSQLLQGPNESPAA